MIVDCDCCQVRGDACGECVITLLLGAPPQGLKLDGTDRRALDTLAAGGLVPRLQLVECDKDHTLCPAEAASAGVAGSHGERSVSGVERSERHVG
jgi:hypothetical protein